MAEPGCPILSQPHREWVGSHNPQITLRPHSRDKREKPHPKPNLLDGYLLRNTANLLLLASISPNLVIFRELLNRPSLNFGTFQTTFS
jgi:hypothetical protein